MSHQTRDWSATESTDLVGSKHVLTVSGEFQFHRSNETGVLKEASPPGINPHILLLDFSITASEAGNDVIDWKPVDPFTKNVKAGQYRQVTIRNNRVDVTVEVQRILS